LFVRLADSGAEGLVPIRSLGSDFFLHDEKRQALVGQRSHVRYGMGDVLNVKLVEATPITGGLRFSLTDATDAGSAPPRRRSGKPGGRPGKPAKKGRFKAKKR
jgi:ribonuclease R